MRTLAFIAALFAASAAIAVPPVLPASGAASIAREFVRATEANDVSAYARLFASDATITTGRGDSLGKAQWLTRVTPEFVPYRQTRFLNVFAGSVPREDGPSDTRMVFVEEVHESPPNAIEQFPRYQVETAIVQGRHIVHFETSGLLSHKLTETGEWTFY